MVNFFLRGFKVSLIIKIILISFVTSPFLIIFSPFTFNLLYGTKMSSHPIFQFMEHFISGSYGNVKQSKIENTNNHNPIYLYFMSIPDLAKMLILKKKYNLFLGNTFILWPLSYALQAQNLYLIISHHLLLCKNYEPSWRVHTSSSILMSFICLSSNDKVLQRCLRREYMTGQWFMNMISFYVAKGIMIWLWYFV